MVWLINFDVLAGRTRKAVLETAVGDFQKHEVTSIMAMVECPSRQQSGTWKSLTGSYPTLPTPWMDFPFLDKWALPTCPHQPQFHYSQSGEMTNLLVAGGSPSVLRPLWWLWKKRWWLVSPLFQLLEKKHSASTLLGPPGWVKAPQLAEAGAPQTYVREWREKHCPQADFLLLLLIMESQEVDCSQGIFDHAGLLTQQKSNPHRGRGILYTEVQRAMPAAILCVSLFNSLSSLPQTEKKASIKSHTNGCVKWNKNGER